MSDLLHYLELSDHFGTPLAVIDRFPRLEYVLTANGVGVLTLDLDPSFDRSLLWIDGRLGVWRRPPDGPLALEGEATWFIRTPYRALSAEGARSLQVTAFHANELLSRRIVAYAAGSAQSSKSGPADDVMKAIVRENMGSLAADTDRDLSAYLSVAADTGQGPTVSKAFARRNVLDVLQEIALQSAQLGTAIHFDVVTPSAGRLEFRTYAHQRGQDRTLTSGVDPLIVSAERGNLAEPSLTSDYSEEITVVYAAGQGQEENRQVVEVKAPFRIARSPFNRRELLVDARNGATTTEALEAEGKAALYAGRPRRIFTGKIVDTPACRYGVHWRWGDRVTAEFDGETFDCEVSTVQVIVEGGRETITASLRAEEAI